MAIASSQAGMVLAWPLSCRLNVHMSTLNTHKVVRIRTSKLSPLGKLLPMTCVGFSAISAYLMAIPYREKKKKKNLLPAALVLAKFLTWNLKSLASFLRSHPDLGPKNGYRSDLLMSNLAKFSWGPTHRYYMWYAHFWPHHLETSWYGPAWRLSSPTFVMYISLQKVLS